MKQNLLTLGAAALLLTSCGGPATLAFTRGCYFEQMAKSRSLLEPNSSAPVQSYENAIEQFTTAIHFNQQYLDAYAHRGICESHLGQLDRAFKDFSQAIALAPGNAKLWNSRAAILEKLGYYDKALEDYLEALRISRKDVDAISGKERCQKLINAAKLSRNSKSHQPK